MPKFKVGDVVFGRFAADFGKAQPYRITVANDIEGTCRCKALFEDPIRECSRSPDELCTEEVALELIRDFIYWCKNREG